MLVQDVVGQVVGGSLVVLGGTVHHGIHQVPEVGPQHPLYDVSVPEEPVIIIHFFVLRMYYFITLYYMSVPEK